MLGNLISSIFVYIIMSITVELILKSNNEESLTKIIALAKKLNVVIKKRMLISIKLAG